VDYTPLDENPIPDELYQNYQDMDETGKDKLLKETEKILERQNAGNEGKVNIPAIQQAKLFCT
jgi:hypothetical protein